VVVVVVVDVVLIEVDVAAIAEDAKLNCAIFPSLLLLLMELQLWKWHLADAEGAFRADVSYLKRYRRGATFRTWKDTVVGVLQMSEDAIVGETTSVAKTGGSPPHTRFCQCRVRHVGAITIMMPVC
jgi:hypothetical protein